MSSLRVALRLSRSESHSLPTADVTADQRDHKRTCDEPVPPAAMEEREELVSLAKGAPVSVLLDGVRWDGRVERVFRARKAVRSAAGGARSPLRWKIQS